jgi:glycosyltransferase involved in cell wall biosynthesis
MYSAVHLEALFDIRSDAVILNPVKPIFLDSWEQSEDERCYITFAGRLDPCKNLHRLLPIVRELLDENSHLRVCVIGEGPQKKELESLIEGDSRFEFTGYVDDVTLRAWLRRTKIFISGNETEGLGIAFLEALSQGCALAMPASGGGIEIALDQIGKSVYLLPLSLDRRGVLSVLRLALSSECHRISPAAYSAEAVAQAYLGAGSTFGEGHKFGTRETFLAQDELK